MSRRAMVVFHLVLLVFCAVPAAAQHPRRYVRLSFGSTRVDAPEGQDSPDRVSSPSVGIGYVSHRGHTLELSVARLAVEAPEPARWEQDTFGMRATPVEVSYQYRAFRGSRLQPLVGIGALWSRVTDIVRTDVLVPDRRTSVYGLSTSLGVVAPLPGGASAAVRGGYQYTRDAGDRVPRAIDLRGLRLDAGLQVAW